LAVGALVAGGRYVLPRYRWRDERVYNWQVDVSPGDSLVMFDRRALRRRLDVKRVPCIVVTDCGTGRDVPVFSPGPEGLLVAFGHHANSVWPERIAIPQIGVFTCTFGEVAIIPRSLVPVALIPLGFVWPCHPGKYYAAHEEVAEVRLFQYHDARNLVLHRQSY
jgi:hypothetical protein